MSKCNCSVCEDNRYIESRIEGMLPEYRPFIMKLYERACEAEQDNSYYRAILEGKWPNSIEILEKSLEKAKAEERWRAIVKGLE